MGGIKVWEPGLVFRVFLEMELNRAVNLEYIDASDNAEAKSSTHSN